MLVTVPVPLAFIRFDNEVVSAVFNLLANLVVRFNEAVSDWVKRKDVSAEIVPVDVIGFGLAIIPVPCEIDVTLPDPPPPPPLPPEPPPPLGKITV